MKSKLPRYLAAVTVGIAIAGLVLYNYGFFAMDTAVLRFRCLSDAFTIPGVLLLAVGCLIWISQQGMFDFLSYTGKVIVDKFRPHAESVRYGDYVLEKNENRKTGGFGFLLITGAAFIAIALLFMALFYIY